MHPCCVACIENEIASALHGVDGIILNHVEAEMMIDSEIRNYGVLIYDNNAD